MKNREGEPLAKKRSFNYGQNLTDAQAGFDSQNPLEPAVHLTLIRRELGCLGKLHGKMLARG